MTLAYDRVRPGRSASGRSAASAFVRARKAEHQYAGQLRKVANHIGDLVRAMWKPDDPATVDAINMALGRYARAIEPWAAAVGDRMVAEVAARDRKAWRLTAEKMGRLIGREIDTAPTGLLMQARLADQVKLITSLPTDAAERVRKLATEGLSQGRRPMDIAREIMRSGEVTKSRAVLIARTEVGRTATELVRARAEHVGSTHYVWRSMGDGDVRKSHKRLDGKIFAWSDPPECDPGHHALPGAIWNCRCYAEPVLREWD